MGAMLASLSLSLGEPGPLPGTSLTPNLQGLLITYPHQLRRSAFPDVLIRLLLGFSQSLNSGCNYYLVGSEILARVLNLIDPQFPYMSKVLIILAFQNSCDTNDMPLSL